MEYVLSILMLPETGWRRLAVFGRGCLCHIKDHFIPHARNNYHPHILGNRTLALFSALLVAVKISIIVALSIGPALPAFSSAITETNIIGLTNQSRSDYNLGRLTENSVLDKAAQEKADDMLQKGYFAHTAPDGKTPWSFIQAAGYNYIMAGENLAVNFSQAENVEEAWMNSPGHKANILNKNFEEIGIGISKGDFQGHEAILVVQMFGTPVEQKIIITNIPTPVLSQSVPEPAAKSLTDSPKGGLSNGPLTVANEQVQIQNNQAVITATLSPNAVKAMVQFGDKAVMLSPKQGNVWQVQAALSDLTGDSQQIRLKVFDMKGESVEKQLADFSASTVNNYSVLGAASGMRVNWFGRTFDPKTVQDRVYLIFIATMLASLILAIGIKRHIQHLNLIANSSFVIMLACLLLMAG